MRARIGALVLLCACPIEPDPAFVDPREGLLFEWVLGDDTTIVDGSGNDRELVLEGATPGDGFAAFDGVDDLGRGPDLADLLPTLDAITFEARVRITDTRDDFESRPIVWVPQTAATGTYGIGLVAFASSGRLQFELVANDEHVYLYRDQLYDDAWVNVHGVFDGAQARLFVDGEEPVDGVPATGPLDGNDFEFGEQLVTVGGRDGPDNRLACEIAVVRAFGRALSADEVLARQSRLE